MDKQNTIVIFDFDKFIVRENSLFDFIKFCFGSFRFYAGLMALLPIITALRLNTITKEAARQEIFYHFFAMKGYDFFIEKCKLYSDRISKKINPKALGKIQEHQKEGHQIIIISSSIADYIAPWAESMGIENVYGTTLEVDENKQITGRLIHHIIDGQAKLNKLLELYPNREDYTLYAYGDKQDSKELLDMADYPNCKTF